MTLQNKTITFIGAGNMGEALIRGLLATNAISPQRLIATDIRGDRLEFLQQTLGIRATADNGRAVADANVVLLAVKPQQMSEVLQTFRQSVTAEKLIITIAAGVTTNRIEKELSGEARVVRAMPNTPALVGAGVAAVCKGQHATDADIETTEAILGAVGITVRTEERLLDAVTALSGSGPAYIFFVAESMINAGIATGLSQEIATRLAVQTIFGAGKLLAESGEAAGSLRLKVTSPGGTTEAAINVMTERKLPEIFVEAI